MKTLRILSIALASLAASSAFAQVTIDQSKALAGGVTPGDTPGFPILISQPGSYKLTGNLTVPSNAGAIEIMAEDVTLDLNGFTIRGPVTCQRDSSTRIVTCSAQTSYYPGIIGMKSGTVVRNGTVRGFDGVGVYLAEGGSSVENLRVTQNSNYGISLSRGDVVGVEAELNRSTGISASGFVKQSAARNNGGSGINADYTQESLSRGNRNYGVAGRGVRATLADDNGIANFEVNVKSMGANLNGATPW